MFFYDSWVVTSPGSTQRGEGGSAGGGRYTQEWDSKWFEDHKPSFYNMKTVVQSDINQTLQDSKEYTQKAQKSTAKYATLKRLSAPRAARSKPGSNPVWGTHKSMKEWISDSRTDRTQEARRAALTRREREAQKEELADWKTKRVDRTIKAEADKLMSKQEEHRYSREVHKFLCDDASNKLNDWAEKRKKQLQQAQKLRHTEDWKLTQKGALDRYTGHKKGSQAGGAAAARSRGAAALQLGQRCRRCGIYAWLTFAGGGGAVGAPGEPPEGGGGTPGGGGGGGGGTARAMKVLPRTELPMSALKRGRDEGTPKKQLVWADKRGFRLTQVLLIEKLSVDNYVDDEDIAPVGCCTWGFWLGTAVAMLIFIATDHIHHLEHAQDL